MREINKKKHRRVAKRKPLPTALAIIYLVLAAAFAAMLIFLNVLPVIYLGVALTLIILVTVLVVSFLLGKRATAGQRIAGLVLSIVFIIVFLVGTIYIHSTQDLFSKITTIGKSTEEYYVVVKKNEDAAPIKVEELEGKTVFIPNADSHSLTEACETLKGKVNVTTQKAENTMKMDNRLLKGKYDAIMVSRTYYQMLEEDNDKFADNTDTIYTLRVEQEVENFAKSVDKIAKTPFNVYISGIDTFGKIEEVSRSDVNMVVTVNPVTNSVLMTNIPRDSYVTLHSYQANDKLTHAGVYGIEESVKTIEDMLNTDINYYVRVNFSTVVDLVDAIGGIEVYSDYSFKTHGRQNRGYKFKKGWNKLNGKEALAFARERYSFKDGDFQRNKNQEIVMKAMLKKILSSKTLLTKYTDILDAVEDEMQTNMSTADIQALAKMQLKDMPDWKIATVAISGGTGMDQCYSLGQPASVVYPDQAQVDRSKARIKKALDGGEGADGEWTWEYD